MKSFTALKRKAQLNRVLPWPEQNEEILPTAEDYRAAASIRAKGAPLELTDCVIAAVSVRLGRTLITGNTDDYQAIQRTGVKLIIDNWREPLLPGTETPSTQKLSVTTKEPNAQIPPPHPGETIKGKPGDGDLVSGSVRLNPDCGNRGSERERHPKFYRATQLTS